MVSVSQTLLTPFWKVKESMRLRHIQYRADAKVLAFAFADRRFFVTPEFRLDPTHDAIPPPPGLDAVGVSWAKFIEVSAKRMLCPGGPLESLRQGAKKFLSMAGPWMTLRLVEGTYFGPSEEDCRALARELWIHRGSPRNDDWADWFAADELLNVQPGEEILRWRWMSLALPTSLLIAAATPSGAIPPKTVRLLDCSIAPDRPVALLHAHLGAMTSFEALWSRLGVRVISAREIGELMLAVQNGNPLGQGMGREWVEALRKGFWVREILLRHAGHSSRLSACSRCELSPELRNVVSHFSTDPRTTIASGRDLSPKPWINERREECFMQRALEHAKREGGQYELLLTQYIRMKVLLFRYIVADPDAHGLTSFVGTFGRANAYAQHHDASDLASEINSEIGLDVRCVEIRTNPRYWLNHHVGKAPFERRATETGWLLHFQRNDGVTASPASTAGDVKRASRAKAKDVLRISSVIRTKPEVLRHLRGLDIAALEREGPLWDFIDALRDIRDVSRQAASACPGLHPLRLSIHVGEDFDHLASGLRAVHEPFAWRLLERGDRLGHALALGLVPSQWVTWVERKQIRMRPWDRLLDIGWMHYALRVFRIRMSIEDRRRLTAEATALLKLLPLRSDYDGNPISQESAIRMAELLWLGLGFADPRIDAHIPGLRERVPEHMLHRSYLIEPASDVPIMSVLQEPLAALISRAGVAIEVNPTSNMIIAGMSGPLEQPMFHLRSTEPNHQQALSLAISSDDPLNFATCLADEYAYAWAGAVVGGGKPALYARAWLEEAAATSMRMRFTLPKVSE